MQNQENKITVNVTVYYHQEAKFESTTKTLKEVLDLVWNSPAFESHSPLKLIFNGTKKLLYMDENLCKSFINDDISLKEFIEKTECENLYRNSKTLIIDENEIEAGHLWKLKGKELFIVDDDLFQTHPINNTDFILVK